MSTTLASILVAIPAPVRSVVKATDPDSPRYALGGVWIERDDDGNCVAVGTDSRRLHCYRWNDGTTGAAFKSLVPGAAFAKADRIEVGPTTDDREFSGVCIGKGGIRTPYKYEGRFPKWRDVIRQTDDVKATWRGLGWLPAMLATIKRAPGYSESRGVVLPVGDDDFAGLALNVGAQVNAQANDVDGAAFGGSPEGFVSVGSLQVRGAYRNASWSAVAKHSGGCVIRYAAGELTAELLIKGGSVQFALDFDTDATPVHPFAVVLDKAQAKSLASAISGGEIGGTLEVEFGCDSARIYRSTYDPVGGVRSRGDLGAEIPCEVRTLDGPAGVQRRTFDDPTTCLDSTFLSEVVAAVAELDKGAPLSVGFAEGQLPYHQRKNATDVTYAEKAVQFYHDGPVSLTAVVMPLSC